jgi:hypothetical protein
MNPRFRQGLSASAPTILIILVIVAMVRLLGIFPLPWNDELAFATSGLDLVQNGRMAESFSAMYHPTFGRMMVFEPPLYPLLVGLALKVLRVDLFGVRALQGVLALILLDQIIRGWWSRAKPEAPYHSLGTLVYLCIALNPYLIRAAFFLRPDIFILLALLWLMGSIWSGRFLTTQNWAIQCGAIFGVSALLHFSAILLIPIFLLGTIDACFRPGRQSLPGRILVAFLVGLLVLLPYLSYLGFHWSEWRALVEISQGHKFSRGQTLWSYLLPPSFLSPILLRGWYLSPSAWGSQLSFLFWITLTVATPLLALAMAIRNPRIHGRSAILLWLLGLSGTWFYIWLPEMWFTSLSFLSIQGVITLLSLAAQERTIRRLSLAWASVHVLCLLHHNLTVPAPAWRDYEQAGTRLVKALEPSLPTGRERLYVSALPDVSVRLLQRWPELRITRGIEFSAFSPVYQERILQEGFTGFIVSEPFGMGPNREIPRGFQFDWNHALYDACLGGNLTVQSVSMGGFHLWLLRPATSPGPTKAQSGDPMRQYPDASGDPYHAKPG